MEIVGITGKMRHGKDTAAEAFVKHHGFVRVAFADAVKEAALALDPIVDFDPVLGTFDRLSEVVAGLGWEEAKEIPEVRRILQRIGTEVVREVVHPRGWLMAWNRKVAELADQGVRHIVVPDVRFRNEADYVTQLGGRVIRVVRPSLPDSVDNHASETEQDDIEADLTVVNEGSAEEFQRRLLGAYYLGRNAFS
jgi:hypothetical protein